MELIVIKLAALIRLPFVSLYFYWQKRKVEKELKDSIRKYRELLGPTSEEDKYVKFRDVVDLLEGRINEAEWDARIEERRQVAEWDYPIALDV